MPLLRRLTVADQIAAHLRADLQIGRLRGVLPTIREIAEDLGVARRDVTAALRLLGREGAIAPGASRRSWIVAPTASAALKKKRLKIGILPLDSLASTQASELVYFFQLRDEIEALEHTCSYFSPGSRVLGEDPARVRRLVADTAADAWIVCGASRTLLESFLKCSLPIFAWGGDHIELPVAAASMDLSQAITESTLRLIELGHRRIILLCNEALRRARRGILVPTFSRVLQENHIPADGYHIPEWEPTPAGLRTLLEELFRFTPPTAIIASGSRDVMGLLSFLNERRLRMPQDVSLIVRYAFESAEWSNPPLAHFRHRLDLLVRSAVRWVSSIADGTPSQDRFLAPAEFVPTGSIAPAK